MTNQTIDKDLEGNTLNLVLESLPVAVMAVKDDIILAANQNFRNYIGVISSENLKVGTHLTDFIEHLHDMFEGIKTEDAEMDALHISDKEE